MNNKGEKIAAVGFCLFFAVLAAFTYISAHVYRRSLPAVTAETPYNGSLRRTYHIPARLYYETLSLILAPADVKIEEWYVREGQAVWEGTPIVRVSGKDLEIAKLELEIALEELEGQINREDREKQKQLLLLSAEKLREELEAVKDFMEKDGIYVSAICGEVTKRMGTEGDSIKKGEGIVELCEIPGDVRIEWELPQDVRLEKYEIMLHLQKDLQSGEETLTFESAQEVYDAETGNMQYILKIPKSEYEVFMHHEEKLQVISYYVSQSYSTLLPKRAVLTDQDGDTYVYLLKSREVSFGTEYYVKKQKVECLEEDSEFVAVEGILKRDLVLMDWNKDLEDSDVVWWAKE